MRARGFVKAVRGRRGEVYIDTAVGFVAAMFAVVLALNVFSFLTLKQDLDYCSKQLCEACCSSGGTAEEAERRLRELGAETGLSPSVSYEGTEYYNAAKKTVQYGETVKVTLTLETHVRGLGIVRFPVTLVSSHSGLSRRYWKTGD